MRQCRRAAIRAGAYCQQITVFECVFCAGSSLQFIAFADVAIIVASDCWLPHANDKLPSLVPLVVVAVAVVVIVVVGIAGLTDDVCVHSVCAI